MIEYLIPITFKLILIIIIYIIYKKYRILKDKYETATKEFEDLQRLEIANKVIDGMMGIIKNRVIFAQKIMISEGNNSLKISEEVKGIIADEVMSFLNNLEPDVTESLKSLYADEARMIQILKKSGKKE